MVSAILTGFLVFLIIFTKLSFVCICIYYQKAAHRRQVRDSLSLSSTTRRNNNNNNNNNNDGRVDVRMPMLELLPPPFDYSAALAKSGVDCAVCLCEFKEKELCRLLPNCKHVFHSQCIDLWFYSHSNCPLCRGIVWPIPSVWDGDTVTASNIMQEEANQTSLLPNPSLDEAMAIQMQGDCPKQVEMASSSNSGSS